MIEETFTVSNFAQFHETIQEIRTFHGKLGRNTIFRGQKSLEYKLVPKVGRIKTFRFSRLEIGSKEPSSLVDHEKNMLMYFKNRAISLLDRMPEDNWEWLAIAQHHGLATRLLDWSKSHLVAAFFAAENNHDKDSAVFAFNRGYFSYRGKDPFDDVEGVKKIIPANYTRRIEVQSGNFTVHEDSRESLEDIVPARSLHKIVIANSFRDELKDILSGYGFNRASLFPDMDGISHYINDYLADF